MKDLGKKRDVLGVAAVVMVEKTWDLGALRSLEIVREVAIMVVRVLE